MTIPILLAPATDPVDQQFAALAGAITALGDGSGGTGGGGGGGVDPLDFATVQAQVLALQTAVTALQGAQWPHLFSKRTASNVVANSATLAADPQLSVPVQASKMYRIEAFLVYDCSTTADLKVGLSVPAGAQGTFTLQGLYSGSTSVAVGSAAPTGYAVGEGSTQNVAGLGVGAGTTVAVMQGVLTVSTTPGTVSVTYAQATAEATNLTVRNDSFLLLTQVA